MGKATDGSADNQAPAATEPAAAVTAAASAYPLSLDEFCTRLSATDRRVEMIGAFHFTEKVNGVVMDTEDNFLARYAAFVDQPA